MTLQTAFDWFYRDSGRQESITANRFVPQVISSHIAGMMASSDVRIVVGSLQLAQVLMMRLPDEMAAQFRREGVLHQLAQLDKPQALKVN